MTTANGNAPLRIWDHLKEAQARERSAAEAHRQTPNAASRQDWLAALQVLDRLTREYIDLSMARR